MILQQLFLLGFLATLATSFPIESEDANSSPVEMSDATVESAPKTDAVGTDAENNAAKFSPIPFQSSLELLKLDPVDDNSGRREPLEDTNDTEEVEKKATTFVVRQIIPGSEEASQAFGLQLLDSEGRLIFNPQIQLINLEETLDEINEATVLPFARFFNELFQTVNDLVMRDMITALKLLKIPVQNIHDTLDGLANSGEADDGSIR